MGHHDLGAALADAMAQAAINESEHANLPLRCTVCGRECRRDTVQYRRHGYGLITEPRCSSKCLEKPFVNAELLATVSRMGAIVLKHRIMTGEI